MQVIEQYEPELLLWDYNKINVGDSYQVTQPIREGIYTKEQMYKEYFEHLIMFKEIEFPPTISNWACLVKREVLETNNIRYNPQIKYCEDSLFGSQCAYFVNSFYYMKNQFLYNYDWNPNSTTKTYHKDKWEVFQKLIQEMESFFGDVDDFDFSEQLKTQVVYLALNTIGEIIKGEKNWWIAYQEIRKVLWSKELKKLLQITEYHK